jgi:hypothetical protein
MNTANVLIGSGEDRFTTGEPDALALKSAPAANVATALLGRPLTRTGIFKAFGLTISSCIDFLELPAAASGDPDVAVVYGDVPWELPGVKHKGVCYQAIPGQVLLQLDGIARFWVRDGKEIVIERHPDAGDDDVRLFLLGSPFGALLHQRGQLVLHGSMVKVDDGCVIFSGPSGVGKSTLAAALRQRGYPCLSDDVCAISLGENGVPYAVGSYPQVKLWPDSLEHLGIDVAGLRRVRPSLAKRALPIEGAVCHECLPVKRLYWICASRHKPDILFQPMTGPMKMKTLRDSTYRLEFLQGLALAASHFKQLADVASRLDLINVARPAGCFTLDRFADAIEGDLRS